MPKPPNYHYPAIGRAIAQMPEGGLIHDHRQSPDEPFRFTLSPLIQWLVSQEEVLSNLFDRFYSAGLIVYNPDTGRWHPNFDHPDVKKPADD